MVRLRNNAKGTRENRRAQFLEGWIGSRLLASSVMSKLPWIANTTKVRANAERSEHLPAEQKWVKGRFTIGSRLWHDLPTGKHGWSVGMMGRLTVTTAHEPTGIHTQGNTRSISRPAHASMGFLTGLMAVVAILAGPVKAERIQPSAIYVVDGDTIRFAGDSWRLVGLDTPETYKPQCDYELALGQAATARLRELVVSGLGVDLVALPGRDRYDRGLARLFIGGENIADILTNEGLARRHDGGRRQSWCG
jgi:endonuclease YncB( thermonuclease family)